MTKKKARDIERVSIPSNATISVEYEREGSSEEVELQIRWTND